MKSVSVRAITTNQIIDITLHIRDITLNIRHITLNKIPLITSVQIADGISPGDPKNWNSVFVEGHTVVVRGTVRMRLPTDLLINLA